MNLTTRWGWMLGLLVALVVLAIGSSALAEAPKVSSFAPAKDVASEIEKYIGRLEQATSSEDEYKDAEGRVSKDANTLILLALAAGLHDEDNKYKEAAPALVKAAQEVAKAKGLETTKNAVAELKKAAESKGDPSSLKWEKVASLPDTMKAVPLINNPLKTGLRASAFKKKASANAGSSATLAVIAQGSMADTSEAKTPEQVKQWQEFCAQFRDAAATVNKAVHDGKQADAEKAMEALTKSCDDCHAVFHKEAGKTE